jgi:phospholipid-translocating ATPase
MFLKGGVHPGGFPTNKLNNQKYNCCTFLPKVLWAEFS